MDTAYVVDTSVLVHDPRALNAFRKTTVAIPIFVVMELDDLKNNRRFEVAAAARVASRFISSLREFGNLSGEAGVHHPDLGTTFHIISDGNGGLDHLSERTNDRSMDLLILASALALKQRNVYKRVVLISKDVNLRILADFEGLEAEDYETDRVQLSDLYTGFRILDRRTVPSADEWGDESVLEPRELALTDLHPNEFVAVRSGPAERVWRYQATTAQLEPVPSEFRELADVQPRNIEQRMALDLLLDPRVKLVTLIGKAGTGKTFLALAAALAQVQKGKKRRAYERILLSKPVVSMGQDVGYLPGDFDTKMQPWMTSFFDNFDQLIDSDNGASGKGATRDSKHWEYLFHSRQLEVQAIHTIRGRSISSAFMVIDEAQNLTPHEVKTVITRAADGTKVVLAGDPYQVDNHFLDQHSNGLVYVTERLKGSPITGTVFFSRGERSELAELAATQL
ncbi:MAG: PhoH family protein [bacterium]